MNLYLILIPLACFIAAGILFFLCALGACADSTEQPMKTRTQEMDETAIQAALLPRRSAADAAWVAEQQRRKTDGKRWVEMFDNWNESEDKK